MIINPMSINYEQQANRQQTPNDVAHNLHQKGEEIKKISEAKPNELVRKDKVEPTNENDKVYEQIKNINEKTSLKYEFTDEGRQTLKILNTEGKVLRQIPSEVALKIYKEIDNFLERNNKEQGEDDGDEKK